MRTVARNTTRGHLSPLRDELGQGPRVLVVDLELFIRTKPTYLPPNHKPAPAWTLFLVHPFAVHSLSWSPLCHFLITPHPFTAGDLPLVLESGGLPDR